MGRAVETIDKVLECLSGILLFVEGITTLTGLSHAKKIFQREKRYYSMNIDKNNQ